MRKDIETTPNNVAKKFIGAAKKGEIRNPAGRPVESEEIKIVKRTTRFQTASTKLGNKTKMGLLGVYEGSNATSIMKCMLDGKLPPQFTPTNYKSGMKISVQENLMNIRQIEKNFRWAMEQIAKILPKELAHSGSIQGEMTLIGMVRRANVEDKSPKIVDIVQKRREMEVYEIEEG